MAMTRACPQCGDELPWDAPQGVCPRCLMQLGFRSGPWRNSPPTQDYSAGSFIAPTPDELAPYFPQLEILELLGQGGMGAVYKARQRGLDRFVALKILPPRATPDPQFAERFTREARALARLNHPNIVAVYDSGQSGELFYFLMEYVDGINLRQAIQQRALTPKEALAVVPQICDALEYAHEEGVVHRDIKPENVLLDRRGRVKVADFGLAKLLRDTPGIATLTGTHQVMGTPRYMAPEQIEGSHEVDHRADLYSLGVVFYELLTGELPLGRFAPPSRKVQVDVRLDEVVLRTLEKEPTLRYQRASEIKKDVESISGVGQLPRAAQLRLGYEYRSKITIAGWPLVHVATGIDPRTGRKRIAKGIIAAGDVAIGGLAMGGVAMGGVTLGGVALGLFSFGGASLGLFAAIGGLAIGGLALGGCAIGGIALGGGAFGYYAFGGGAAGVHAWGGNVHDPQARALFENWGDRALDSVSLFGIFSPVFMLLIMLGVGGLIFVRRWREASAVHWPGPKAGAALQASYPVPKPPRIEDTLADSRRRVRIPALGLMLVGILHLLLGFVLPVSILVASMASERSGFIVGHLELALLLTMAMLGLFPLLGGVSLLTLRSYTLALLGCTLAILPCTPLWLVGLPLGMYSLITLARPEVQQAFEMEKQRRLSDD